MAESTTCSIDRLLLNTSAESAEAIQDDDDVIAIVAIETQPQASLTVQVRTHFP